MKAAQLRGTVQRLNSKQDSITIDSYTQRHQGDFWGRQGWTCLHTYRTGDGGRVALLTIEKLLSSTSTSQCTSSCTHNKCSLVTYAFAQARILHLSTSSHSRIVAWSIRFCHSESRRHSQYTHLMKRSSGEAFSLRQQAQCNSTLFATFLCSRSY